MPPAKRSSTNREPSIEAIAGYHAVASALSNARRLPGHLYVTNNARRRLGSGLEQRASCVSAVSAGELDAVLARHAPSAGRISHQGLLYLVAPLPRLSLEEALQLPRLIALDKVEDVGNIGSIVRAAAFFGVGAVLIPNHGSVGDSARASISRIASGGAEHTALVRCGNLSQLLAQAAALGFEILGFCETAAQEYSQEYSSAFTKQRQLLVFGAESSGLRPLVKKRCSAVVRLPASGVGQFSTLNVAQSVVAALTLTATK